jgi:hypothetical protein
MRQLYRIPAIPITYPNLIWVARSIRAEDDMLAIRRILWRLIGAAREDESAGWLSRMNLPDLRIEDFLAIPQPPSASSNGDRKRVCRAIARLRYLSRHSSGSTADPF